MKRPFRRKTSLAWGTIVIFGLLALLWHLPLLVVPSLKRGMTQSPQAPSLEHYLVIEPPQPAPSGTGISWMDPTIYLLPTDVGYSMRLRRASILLPVVQESLLLHSPLLPFEAPADRSAFSGQDALTMAQAAFNDEGSEETGAPHPNVAPSEEGSAWRAVGSIAGRQPAAPSALPSIVAVDDPAPTVLRVGVGAEGEARFVTLERSSGLEKADDEALRFVRGIRFAAVDFEGEENLAWGFVKILWRAERPVGKR